MERLIVVARDGSGDFASVGSALAAAERLPPGGLVVLVREGEYFEKLRVMRAGLRLRGEGAGRSVIRHDDGALRLLPDGQRMGTFNSYALYVGAIGVRVQDLTIENSAGDGRTAGQAVALYADADDLSFTRCAILGRQDTLFTGPLPKDPVPKGVNLLHPVAGLGADEPALPFRQLYEDCLISGDVDFIFGSAAATFDRCEIRSLPRLRGGGRGRGRLRARGWEHEGGDERGWICAPSTYPGQERGFAFLRCALTGPGTEPGSVYLGRPWRACAQAAFVDCAMGAHIAPDGWDDWGKDEARELSRFSERGSTGPGARGPRVAWASVLDAARAATLEPRR